MLDSFVMKLAHLSAVRARDPRLRTPRLLRERSFKNENIGKPFGARQSLPPHCGAWFKERDCFDKVAIDGVAAALEQRAKQ